MGAVPLFTASKKIEDSLDKGEDDMKKIIVGLLLIAAFVAIASQRKDKTYNVSPDGGIKRIEHAGFIDMTLEEKEFDTDLMFYSGRCTWRAETGAEGENVQVPVKAFILQNCRR